MKTKQLLTLAVATAIAGITMLGATSATSDYMHYQDGTISICDPSSNGTKCITMQDRNLGATQAGIGCIPYQNYCTPMWENDYGSVEACIEDANYEVHCNLSWESFGNTFSSKSDCEERGESLYETCLETHSGEYGKHFQRGNNHGFLPGENNSAAFPGGENTSNSQINCSANSPSNPVNSSAFIVGYRDYCTTSTRNDNLRGGANDTAENNYGFNETDNVATNVANRRGPCEDGYHVPSIGEWNQVLEYWAEENGIELEDNGGLKGVYSNGLKFQEDFKIPFAGYRHNEDAKVYLMGNYAPLWSSSPRVGGGYARDFYLDPGVAYANDYNTRAIALSVRCFKNSYLEFPSSEGGDSEIIVNIAALNNGQNTCTLDNYIFSGIFASPSVVFRNISQSMHCIFGNANGSVVTLQLSGDLTDGSGNTIPAGNVRLKNTAWTATPAGLQGASSAISDYTSLNQTLTLFNKVANKIGEATGSAVDIQVEIPGGTPDGVYNGTLVLSY